MRRSRLEELDDLFERCVGSLLVQRAAREQAYRRAQAKLDAGGDAPASFAVGGYAAEVVIAHAVELAAHQTALGALIERLDTTGLTPRVVLAPSVLRAPELLRLPSAVAIEVQLGLLRGFSQARAVSVWTLHRDGELKHVAHAGDCDLTADPTRRLARGLLGSGRGKPESTRSLVGLRIEQGHHPAAALVTRGTAGASAGRRWLLGCAAPMLEAMLERDELLDRAHRPEEVVVAAERRLARLRFDLHDGPQQDVVLLAEDLALLRAQLDPVVGDRRDKSRVLGRLDDLQARLVAIDGDLRRISAFVQSPFLHADGVPEALAKLAEEFTARGGIEPEVRLQGDFGDLTDSQKITLLGLIREALSNIREHSQAEQVTIRVVAAGDGVEATVTDDGRGFDPETTLVEAARGGHLGLVGMHERVHMLGGRTEIDSRPGGPTVISARLPRYTRATSAPEMPQALAVRSEVKPGRAGSRART